MRVMMQALRTLTKQLTKDGQTKDVREEVGYWDSVAFCYFPFTVQVLFLWGVNPPLTRMYSLLVYKLVFFIYFFFWMILNKNRAMIFTTTTIFVRQWRNLFNRPSVCNPQLSRIYHWMFLSQRLMIVALPFYLQQRWSPWAWRAPCCWPGQVWSRAAWPEPHAPLFN